MYVSMAEGWLIDRDRHWACRFHRDEGSWVREPMVFVDLGRGMPDGQPLRPSGVLMLSRDPLLCGVARGWMSPAADEPLSRLLFRNA